MNIPKNSTSNCVICRVSFIQPVCILANKCISANLAVVKSSTYVGAVYKYVQNLRVPSIRILVDMCVCWLLSLAQGILGPCLMIYMHKSGTEEPTILSLL
jgi:hypothetical protein